MSDPVWKGEIEDVIASIRRLVSAAPDAHRLVLTDALRVDLTAEDPADTAQDVPPNGTAASPASQPGPLRLDGAVVRPGTEARPAPGNSSLEQALAELEAELALAADPVDGDDTDADADDGFDPWEPAEVPASTGKGDGADIVIEAEPLADVAAEPGPEAEVLVFSRSSRAQSAASRRATVEGGDDAGAAPRGAAPDPGDQGMAARADAATDPLAGAEAPADNAAGNGAGNPAADASGDNVAKPDVESLLDEADLRALVAEVLREELKGPLGERITRNVRKLVRREIALALSRDDLS